MILKAQNVLISGTSFYIDLSNILGGAGRFDEAIAGRHVIRLSHL
jgi:hypothetical protein